MKSFILLCILLLAVIFTACAGPDGESGASQSEQNSSSSQAK